MAILIHLPHRRDRFDQRLQPQRFRQQRREAGFLEPLEVVLPVERSQHHDRDIADRHIRLDEARQFLAVHFRHEVVDDRHLERVALRLRLAQNHQRLRARGAGFDAHADLRQMLAQDQIVDAQIVHHQQPHVLQQARRRAEIRERILLLAGGGQHHREPEGRAHTRFALNAEIPAHHRRELFGDGEPQPRAAEFARGRAIRLHEFLENMAARFFRNADARIRHRNLDMLRRRLAARRLRERFHRQHDMAFLRELDRIAQQIRDHLPRAHRVADDEAWCFRAIMHHDFERFLACLHRQQFRRAFDHLQQIERDDFHIEPPGFDLREIEDVVDDVQQRLRRLHDRVGVMVLLVRQLRFHHQLGHAEDAVHRRADFVAHRREEFALRTVGVFRRFPRGERFRLRLFHIDDGEFELQPQPVLVGHHALVAHALAHHEIQIADDHARHREPARQYREFDPALGRIKMRLRRREEAPMFVAERHCIRIGE